MTTHRKECMKETPVTGSGLLRVRFEFYQSDVRGGRTGGDIRKGDIE